MDLPFALARRLLSSGPKVIGKNHSRSIIWRALDILYSEKALLIDWIIDRSESGCDFCDVIYGCLFYLHFKNKHEVFQDMTLC
jgi:hypothetical protein